MIFTVSEEFIDDYIRFVLFYKWDPTGISGYRTTPEDIQDTDGDILTIHLKPTTFAMGITEDEYDSYMPRLKQLMIDHESEKEIYQYLRSIEIHCMSDANAANTKSAAKRLFIASRQMHVSPTETK